MFLMENRCFPKVFHTFWRVSEDRCRLGEIPLPLEKYEIPYAKHYFSRKTSKLLRKTEVSTFSVQPGPTRPGKPDIENLCFPKEFKGFDWKSTVLLKEFDTFRRCQESSPDRRLASDSMKKCNPFGKR